MAKVGTVSLLQEATFRAYVDLINKRKIKNGVDNALMQEIKSLHSNTSLGDIRGDLRSDINEVADMLLGYITGQGFKLTPVN